MNLRRQRPSDSLDMLLDTMCNTFGGIILLAVLVTLLTSRERQGNAATASDTREMLQRRLTLAQASLQHSLQLLTGLEAKSNDDRWKKQVTLLATRRRIQQDINRIHELTAQSAKEIDKSTRVAPADRMKQLNAQLAAAQAQKLQALNSLAASQENTTRLKARITTLEKQATDLVQESQRQLRLPKEHETGKRVIYLIARHGRIYPCRTSDLSRNEADITWKSTSTSEAAEPKPGRGIDPAVDPAALRTYFRTQSDRPVYVVFCVFEDSFPAFIRAKQFAIDSGLAYGWEPFQLKNGPVSFSAAGHTPKPQ